MKIEEQISNYMVHFILDGSHTTFQVYPIYECTDLKNNKSIAYRCKDSSDIIINFDPTKCLLQFEGYVGWCGVWDCRLYFSDDEYWGNELQEMSILYNTEILHRCKTLIKENNKDYFEKCNLDEL